MSTTLGGGFLHERSAEYYAHALPNPVAGHRDGRPTRSRTCWRSRSRAQRLVVAGGGASTSTGQTRPW